MTGNTAAQTTSRDVLLTACPHCRRLVRLPSAVSIESLVQCPSCSARYPVRSLLPDDLPELVLVTESSGSAPATESSQSAGGEEPRPPVIIGKLEVSEILRNGARRRRHRSSRSSGTAEAAAPSLSPSQPSSGSRHGRRRRSSGKSSAGRSWDQLVQRESRVRDPRMEMIKVIAGALLALPVAQLIIWWVLGVDPFRIAPVVQRVAPAFVPPSLRQKADGDKQAILSTSHEPDRHHQAG